MTKPLFANSWYQPPPPSELRQERQNVYDELADLRDSLGSGDYAATDHTHDDRYYTETEVDTFLAGKAATSHGHTVADISDISTNYLALSGGSLTGPLTAGGGVGYTGSPPGEPYVGVQFLDGVTNKGYILHRKAGSGTAYPYTDDGLTVVSDGAGGLNLAARQTGAPINFYAGGNNQWMKLGSDGYLTLSSASPTLHLTDTNNAGAGKNYWIHNNGGVLYFLQDRVGNGTWQTPYPLMIRANGQLEIGHRLYASSTSRGSVTLSNGAYWTPASGLYTWLLHTTTSGYLAMQINVGGTWYRSDTNEAMGHFATDGTNVRLYNASGFSVTLYYARFGG